MRPFWNPDLLMPGTSWICAGMDCGPKSPEPVKRWCFGLWGFFGAFRVFLGFWVLDFRVLGF